MAQTFKDELQNPDKLTRDAIALLNDILAPRSRVLKFRTGDLKDILLVDIKSNKAIKLIPINQIMMMSYDQLMRL